MPHGYASEVLTARERRRQVAAILAKGVVRWRKRAKNGSFMPAPESSPVPENRLDLPGETRLSVSDGTRRLCLRDDGDDS